VNQIANDFAAGILYLCQVVMAYVGVADKAICHVMTLAGLSAQVQTYVLIVATALIVALAMRAVGGVFGWVVLLLMVLLLLHHVIPNIATPSGTLAPSLQNAMN
jgi:hypothetical protein